MVNEIIDLFNYLNSTGSSIPIQIITTQTTNPSQFWISIMFSSIMLFWLFGSIFIESVKIMNGKILLKIFSKQTGRPLVLIKHTMQDFFSSSMIDQSTLKNISLAMNEFKGKDFDLILHTPGGEIFAALYISRIFKQYPGKIRSIIPIYAMSGGTLLALSTSEVYMSPVSCLGPVDPQLGSLFSYGSARAWKEILRIKGKKAEDSSITMNFMGRQYTESIKMHLDSVIKLPMSEKDKKRFIEVLTSGELEHAFALTPNELKILGVPIRRMPAKIGQKLIKLILKFAPEGVSFVK